MTERRRLKTKDLIKRALNNPELFTSAELDYFKLIKKFRKDSKDNRPPKSDYLK